MTAEIAILNKNGIALAADSAVSIGSPQNTQKIYNSANKLFMLSKIRPIAIMIYGGGGFIGIPWELIVKEYREELGLKSFPSLTGYAADFWEFITNNRRIFPEDVEKTHVLQKIATRLIRVRDDCRKKIRKEVEQRENLTSDDFKDLYLGELTKAFEEDTRSLKSQENLDRFTSADYYDFLKQYKAEISEIAKEVFENIYDFIGDDLKKLIEESLALSFIKKDFDQSSGVVFAGYGDNDIFPKVATYQVGIMLHGKPRSMFLPNSSAIEKDFAPTIIPFAQVEVVSTFLTGIDPNIDSVLKYLRSDLSSIVSQRVSNTVLNQAGDEAKSREELKAEIDRFMVDLGQTVDQIKHDTVLSPILDMLEYLPKGELAEMAETLVNLTAFKRKMSNALESVGGPIDVAVISKGDGFIWYNRKHYFRPELNQHFFANYYRKNQKEP